MKTKTAPALIGLGSARAATRADLSGEKMELNPVFHYTEDGARAFNLGPAAEQTRAGEPFGVRELIPVDYWTI
jgi:hypothetical protein